MKRNRGLSQYFRGVAGKRLSATDVDPRTSNGREIQGNDALRSVLGTAARKKENPYPCRYVFIDDSLEIPVSADGTLSWYDTRSNKPHRNEEWRAYYSKSAYELIENLQAGDYAFIGLRTNDTVLIVFARGGTAMERRLRWLFGLPDDLKPGEGSVPSDRELTDVQALVLDQLGLGPAPESVDADRSDLLREFSLAFPATTVFSKFARGRLPMDPVRSPDAALVGWFNREESLFRLLEREILAAQLKPFTATSSIDVEAFMAVAMSAIQRRKSRAGYALENHLEEIFNAHRVRFDRSATTELKKAPDFLFPGAKEYRDPKFPASRLTMLGAKATGKDRWRQVISEANRISRKHYLTLETAISAAQTAEMEAAGVQLVVPEPLHTTFTPAQRGALWTLEQFISEVKRRQA